MDDITGYLKKSIEDDFLSKDEKKSLSELIGNRVFSRSQRDSLQRTAYELAASKITDPKSKFILDWLQQTSLAIRRAPESASEAWFSPGESCKQAIIREITNAVSSLRICVFTISDDSIVTSVLTAHKKGIKIRILTDNDKSLDLGSDVERLARAGIQIRMDVTSAHMHHKFMVADDRRMLSGSYNWTQSAARMNHENIIVTGDETLVKAFAGEFDRLWLTMEDIKG